MENSKKQSEGYIPNSVEATVVMLNSIRRQIAELKEDEEKIKDQLLSTFAEQIKSAYKEKSEPFGVVNFNDGDYKISFTTPKKVKWDQRGLAELHKDGAPVDVEYSVKEAVFKDLDDEGKAIMMKHRTVEPGSVAIKIEAL